MKSHRKQVRFLKMSFVFLVVSLSLAAFSAKEVYSKTPNTYILTRPDLSKVPANIELTNIPFTLIQTGGSENSPKAKIRVTVTNKPEGADVEIKQQNPDGSSHDVIGDDYSAGNSFVIPMNTVRTDLYTIKFSTHGDYTFNYSLIDLDESKPYIVNENVDVTVVPGLLGENVPDENGLATLDTARPQVIIRSALKPVLITVKSDVSNPTLNFSSLTSAGSGILPKTTINTSSSIVEIPATTTVTSIDSGWDGVMRAPTAVPVILPNINGETRTLIEAIGIGSNSMLTFDKAVRFTILGKAGLKVGFMKSGSLVPISTTCSIDNQISGNLLPASGDCYIEKGNNLIVWTKHFTTFVVYSATIDTAPSGGGSQNIQAPINNPVPPSPHHPISMVSDNSVNTVNTTSVLASVVTSNETPQAPQSPLQKVNVANVNSSTTSSSSFAVVAIIFFVLGAILWSFVKRI